MRIRNPKNRLRKILDACKNKTKCEGGDEIDVRGQDSDEPIKKKRSGCGAQQPKISIDGMKMIAEYKLQKKRSDDQEQLPEPVERKQQLTAEKVLSVLKRISDDDCQLLGLNPIYARPDWLILQVLPVPPPPVRPSVMMDTSSRSEDDLTHQLAMIVRHNENLKRQERNGAPAHIISEFAQLLQFHIATYFDNDLPGQPRSNSIGIEPMKSGFRFHDNFGFVRFRQIASVIRLQSSTLKLIFNFMITSGLFIFGKINYKNVSYHNMKDITKKFTINTIFHHVMYIFLHNTIRKIDGKTVIEQNTQKKLSVQNFVVLNPSS
ncbi:DNA-directed RNA polymerase II subunit 1, partial [Olea europaea subsp. europaea]